MINSVDVPDASVMSRSLPVRRSSSKLQRRDNWLLLAPIVLLGAISALAYYFGLTRPYPLADLYQTPLLELGKITGGTIQAANGWIITWLVLFAAYYLAFRICPSGVRVSAAFRRTALAIIGGGSALFTGCLFFMYPITAADIFDQIFRARITSHYALSPFTTFPGTFNQDPLQRFVAWNGEGSPYGPVWEVFAAIPGWLAGDNLWNNLLYFKALVAIFYIASTVLTYFILRSLKPDWALRGTLFFAWNPLVLFEVAGNGHNDIVMVTFVLLAVYLFVRGQRIAVLPALMLGVLAKFIPLLLVPIAMTAIWRDRLNLNMPPYISRSRWNTLSARMLGKTRAMSISTTIGSQPWRAPLSNRAVLTTLAIGGLLSLALAVIFYLPFWEGTKTIGALGRQTLFTTSLPTLSYLLLQTHLHISITEAQGIARNAALAIVAITIIGLTLFVFLKGNANTISERQALVSRTLGAFYEMIFVYLAFATLWFQPWYLIWLVALTPPVALYTNANRTVLFCTGGVAAYFVGFFMWGWTRANPLDMTTMGIIAVYFLTLFYTLYSALKLKFDNIWSSKDRTPKIDEKVPGGLPTRPLRTKA
ncbi:MAG: hypothetical protein ABI670_08240 [Chloroflexota bacterium]